MDNQAQDEVIDHVTGEVCRREVPISPLSPEPADLGDPVPYPFPGNDVVLAVSGVPELQQPDPHEGVPDPDASHHSISAASRQRGLEGLSKGELVRAGVGRDEASRMAGETPGSEGEGSVLPGHRPDIVGRPQGGPVAGVPVGGELHVSDYNPPTDGEILGAGARGVAGACSRLYESWKACEACELSRTRQQVVLGAGNDSPRYIIVGQAPGPSEDQQGGPFVGPAGRELTDVLNTVQIHRPNECYLLNTVCCRPIDPVTGRVCPPNLDEIAACRPRLTEQIKILLRERKTKVIILLGKEAYVDFFYKTEIEARTFNMDAFRVGPKLGWQDMSQRRVPDWFPKVYFTYHPSFILRNGSEKSPDYRAWQQDFVAIQQWAVDGVYIKPRGHEVVA